VLLVRVTLDYEVMCSCYWFGLLLVLLKQNQAKPAASQTKQHLDDFFIFLDAGIAQW
jgi:hypothetical protein